MVFNRSTPMGSISRQHGLTLVEVAVVASVVAVVAAAAAPGMGGLLDTRRLHGFATQLAADLQLARSEAIQRNQPVRLTQHATSACYVVHTGSAAACRCADTGPALCDAGAAQIRTVRWSAAERVAVLANGTSILFDPQHGTASPAATLRVVGADGRAIHHVINLMGRVRSCAGLGHVPGYRAC
jgi:type IV fimbrial biogenesis protein FimT